MSKKPKNTEKSLDDVYQAIKSLKDEIEFLRTGLANKIEHQSWRITDLNETVYEDRHVLAEFVRRFMRTPDDLADSRGELFPGIGTDGGRKAKK